MTIWVYSGDRPSNGAKELSKLPGFKRCRTGKFIKPIDIVINWGCSTADLGHVADQVLNVPLQVSRATNKLTAFALMKVGNVQTVEWCKPDDHETLAEWQAKESVIIGRQKLTGHSGDGIIIIDKGEALQPALLYTRYIFKEREYRVHVVDGKVIDTQKKIRDPDRVPTSWKVRSHENGFIFARNGIEHSDNRDGLAVAAVHALGLDFGAVDIIEDKHGKFYVLEVNTAPGLEGQTIINYGEAFSGRNQA